MALISLLAEHTGSALAATVGDRLHIELDENPTTGYRWQPPSRSELLELVHDDYAPAGDGGVGGGGRRTLVYEARAAGRGSLKLALARAWESEGAPSSTFAIELEISAGEPAR